MANSRIPVCHRCKTVESVLLRYNIISNGTHQYFWYCTHCACITPPGTFLNHEKVNGWHLGQSFYDKALLNNYMGTNPCAVRGCQSTDTERHHFAPKEFWGKDDAEFWPIVYLCRYHHRMWHDVISGTKQYTGDHVIEMQREEMRVLNRAW